VRPAGPGHQMVSVENSHELLRDLLSPNVNVASIAGKKLLSVAESTQVPPPEKFLRCRETAILLPHLLCVCVCVYVCVYVCMLQCRSTSSALSATIPADP